MHVCSLCGFAFPSASPPPSCLCLKRPLQQGRALSSLAIDLEKFGVKSKTAT